MGLELGGHLTPQEPEEQPEFGKRQGLGSLGLHMGAVSRKKLPAKKVVVSAVSHTC